VARTPLTATGHRLRIAATAAPLLAILLFGVGLLHRRAWRIDLTPGQRYTLSARSKEVVARLSEPLRVRAFMRTQDPRNVMLQDLLRQLEAAAPRRVRTTVTDVNRAPAVARELGVRGVAFVLELGGRRRVVSNPNEDAIIGGILELMRSTPLRVGWVLGHGEGNPESGERRAGYASLRRALELDNRVVLPVSLAESGLDEDLDVVLIVAPRGDLLPGELRVLDAYLRSGGAAGILLGSGAAPRLAAYLERYGVLLADDVVVDPAARLYGGEDLTIRLTLDQRNHPVVAALAGPPLFSRARSVRFEAADRGIEGLEFLFAGASSFAAPRSAGAATDRIRFDPARDRKGPIPVGVEVRREAGDEPGRRGRMIVLGSGEFASNFFLDFLGNKDLVLNAVAWLGRDDDAIGIRTQRQRAGVNQLYVSEADGDWIYRIAVLVEPVILAILGLGVVAWRRRV